MSWKRITETQLWRSVFRHRFEDTPRNRALTIVSNAFLHLHPVTLPRSAMRVRFTFCLGGLTLFMFLAGTNFMLLYALVIFRPKRLLADIEWRTYVTILAVVTVAVIGFGLYHCDFAENGT